MFHLAVQYLTRLLDGGLVLDFELADDLLHVGLHIINLCSPLVSVLLLQLEQVQVSFSFDLKIAFHLDDI